LEEFLPQLGLDADISQLALSAGGLSTAEIKTGLRVVKAKRQPLVEGLLDFKIERLKAFNLSFIPRPNVGNFGGMDRIREGIEGIKKDYSQAARQYGIPLPKDGSSLVHLVRAKLLSRNFVPASLNFR
jgi:hypothetical protein